MHERIHVQKHIDKVRVCPVAFNALVTVTESPPKPYETFCAQWLLHTAQMFCRTTPSITRRGRGPTKAHKSYSAIAIILDKLKI
jgi:hypothetical protein